MFFLQVSVWCLSFRRCQSGDAMSCPSRRCQSGDAIGVKYVPSFQSGDARDVLFAGVSLDAMFFPQVSVSGEIEMFFHIISIDFIQSFSCPFSLSLPSFCLPDAGVQSGVAYIWWFFIISSSSFFFFILFQVISPAHSSSSPFSLSLPSFFFPFFIMSLLILLHPFFIISPLILIS
ncbi:unnamed protein product [Acanthosepion pharaonis]|uniref:Uncharacterized protein n=1 Tax=Acanthosepion pharaonis TaxID=158019 RepID=A0A812CRZ0_ACAPH|nr:unnamed protein product [Sepia pharaonis]